MSQILLKSDFFAKKVQISNILLNQNKSNAYYQNIKNKMVTQDTFIKSKIHFLRMRNTFSWCRYGLGF